MGGKRRTDGDSKVVRLDKAAMYRICRLAIAHQCSYAEMCDKIIGSLKEDVDLSSVDFAPYKTDRSHASQIRVGKTNHDKLSNIANKENVSKSACLSFLISQFPEE